MASIRQIPIGSTFGSLATTSSVYVQGRRGHVRVVCACGTRKEVLSQNLLRGSSTSCGSCVRSALPKAGDTVGLWSVTRLDGNYAYCTCTCGVERRVYLYSLVSDSTSCGHNRRNDGRRRAKLKRIWALMLDRCHNPTSIGWSDYGRRGIEVSEPWKSDFDTFYHWSIDQGYQMLSGLQIDRIDYNGNYCPENCRWVDKFTNARNKRNTVVLDAFGECKPLMDWLEDPRCLVPESTLRERVSNGWPHEGALRLPKHSRKPS